MLSHNGLTPSTQTSAPQAISPMMGNVQLRFVQHSCIFNLVRQYQTLMAKDPGTPLQLTLCASQQALGPEAVIASTCSTQVCTVLFYVHSG